MHHLNWVKKLWQTIYNSNYTQKCSNYDNEKCAKYLMFDLKKYRGVIFHDTEGWCKIWRKTDLWFGKWHEEYGKFSPEQLKVSKLGYWSDPLIQSRKSMSLKSTEELCVMTMKNDAKFKEELSKVYIVWAKKVQRNNLSWNWRGL